MVWAQVQIVFLNWNLIEYSFRTKMSHNMYPKSVLWALNSSEPQWIYLHCVDSSSFTFLLKKQNNSDSIRSKVSSKREEQDTWNIIIIIISISTLAGIFILEKFDLIQRSLNLVCEMDPDIWTRQSNIYSYVSAWKMPSNFNRWIYSRNCNSKKQKFNKIGCIIHIIY